MCGRYVSSSSSAALAAYFDVDEVMVEAEAPSYNVAPTDPVPAVALSRDGHRRLGLLRWGLVPPWAKDAKGAARMINARAETVLSKPAFRSAFSRRRCLLPADGFYEWERVEPAGKRPWFIHRADGAPLAFAGLWESWSAPNGDRLRTCSVITTTANALMTPVHDRMPVLLDRADWGRWLDPGNEDIGALASLLRPAEDGLLERYPVASLVNSVKNNGPDLIAPHAPHPEGDLHR